MDLVVVMPVYNEGSVIESVVGEWISALRALRVDFKLLVVDDGSKDATPQVLKRLESVHSELLVHTKKNGGHGAACLDGYKKAIEMNALYILQLDSDGQCDPKYLPAFWAARNPQSLVIGRRVWREDGLSRMAISRILSLTVFLSTRVWIRDANTPYRLFPLQLLQESLNQIDQKSALPNVLLSVAARRKAKLRWIPIVFRVRNAGKSSLNLKLYIRLAKQLVDSLKTVSSGV